MSPTLPRLADLTAAATREQESLDFTKYLSCVANWRGQAGSAAELYLHRFNNSYGASLVRKSMSDGGLETENRGPGGHDDGCDLGETVSRRPAVNRRILGGRALAELLGRIPGVQLVPVNTKIPFQTADANFVWMPESYSAPTSKLAFSDGLTLPPTKIVGIVVLTAELAKLSAPGTEKAMRNCLIQGLNSFVDKQFLSTTAAVVGTNPAGHAERTDAARRHGRCRRQRESVDCRVLHGAARGRSAGVDCERRVCRRDSRPGAGLRARGHRE